MNATTSASSSCLLLTLLACGTWAADRPFFLLHLPAATVGAIEVNDFRRAVQTYRDPQLRDSDKRKFEQLQEEFGLTVELLSSIASGKAWRIDLSYGQTSLRQVLVLEIDDKAQVQAMLDKERVEQDASSNEKPKLGDDGEITYRIEQRDKAGGLRGLVRILSDRYLILAGNPAAAREVFAALQGLGPSHDDQGFPDFPRSELFERAIHPDDIVVSWLVHPWTHLKQIVAKQLATPEEENAWKYAQRHGLVGIPTFGGSARFTADSTSTGRAFVLAPRPRAHTLNMLTLTTVKDIEIPRWLARGVDDMLLLLGDVPAALEQMDRVFDDLLADGIDGTYREILEDVKSPDGLNVDLEKELFPHLGPRVFVIRSTPDGAPRDSESGKKQPQLLFAIETQDATSVAATLSALMKDDTDVCKIHLHDLRADVWRVESSEAENRPCLAVIHGYAMYATDYSILAEQLAPAAKEYVTKLDAINAHLRQIVTPGSPLPSMIVLRGKDLHVAAESDSDGGHHALKTATPAIRNTVLGAFFNSVSTRLQTKGYASFLSQITEKTADPIVVGFARDNGWFFVGSNSLSDSHQE